ncbi:MAG: ABC transporter substrate-binding protein [Acidimicrobiia bacterium]|nr:ABC transporter substrate-binding protein [Acidimicrobiia bacterium]
MTKTRLFRLFAIILALGLVAAACGSDDDVGGDSAADVGGEGVLAGVCPDPLVIQTDWFPESEHGALYELIGDDYTVDTGNKIVSGSMVLGGEDLGVDFEVRTGGPAIGFAPVSSHMYTDDAIHLGYATTDGQVLRLDEAPLLSVVAPLEQNPQIIMWDPETYPDVESIADLGAEGVTINVFAGGTFAEVFVAQGIWSADQVDPSYDGGPARFISEGGGIAQQGFASAEPFSYEFEFEEWGKPVGFETLHDAGFQVYSQTVAIRPADLEDLRSCLELVVPIIQQSVIDYAGDPARANDIIVDAVEQYADFWVYNTDLAAYSTETQTELGLIGNGPDDTVGNMEGDRIQTVIDQIRDAGLEVSDEVSVDTIMTNEFIDESIGF